MPVLPSSLIAITSLLRPAFTAPTFQIFEALLAGFIGRVSERTVCGIWQAARLAGRLHHSRAHDFFTRTRWSVDGLGLLVCDFLIDRLLEPGAPIRLAVDTTVFARSGRKVHAASWHYEPSARAGRRRYAFGNAFVVLGLVVRSGAFGDQPRCLPFLFRLWEPTPKPTKREPKPSRRPSQPELAALLVARVAERYPDRPIELLADAGFPGKALAALPERVALIGRLPSNIAITDFAPPRTGKRGRPRATGERLGNPRELAAGRVERWRRCAVPGKGETMALAVTGLWYPVYRSRAVRVVLVRPPGRREGYGMALITTDLESEVGDLVARYSDRWSIEVAFQEAKGVVGVGEARNRTRRAVERTVPFGFICQTIALAWYALNGDRAADVSRRRRVAPWYQAKREPSMLDILASLRRELIRAEFRASTGRHARRREITRAVRRAEAGAG